ncbi:hypothetical protein Tco_0298746 [Tanacetum coccineum]
MGIMPTKTELALEQTQQGVSNEVLNIRVILLSIHNDDGNPTSANIKQALRQILAKVEKYEELSATEKIQADCDWKATNIVLQGLPPDVYAIVNHHKVAKEIWDRVKLLMQGTKLSLQEKECKLYDEFDKFTFVKGETLYQYYWRFSQLINNMNVNNMSMRAVQVNTKFLNSLPLEWSKFVTDVKMAIDFHTTNYDQLYSYLKQHEVLSLSSSSYFLVMSKNDIKDHICAISKNDLKDLVKTYRIPLDLHPCLPDLGFTMDRLHAGSIGIYSKFLWFSGFRVPFLTFLISVLKYFKVHISQLVPLGLNKVVSFEVVCYDLNIVPTVTLFSVFQCLCKQWDWFSFSKRRNTEDICMDDGPSSLKKGKNKFSLIDRRAILDHLTWRHFCSCVSDDLPFDGYDRNDVQRLCACLIFLREIREEAGSDAKIAEESHHLSLPLLECVSSHTTAPTTEGAIIPLLTPDDIAASLPDSCLVKKSKDEDDIADLCAEIEDSLERDEGVSMKAVSAPTPRLGKRLDSPPSITVMSASEPSYVGTLAPASTSGHSLFLGGVVASGCVGKSRAEIDLTLSPLTPGPYHMPYPYEGVSSPLYTKEEWNGPHAPERSILCKDIFKDPDVCRKALDRTITPAELRRTESFLPLELSNGVNVLSALLVFHGYELNSRYANLVSSKAYLQEKLDKKKWDVKLLCSEEVKKLQSQLTNAKTTFASLSEELTQTDAKLSEQALTVRDLQNELVLKESKSQEHKDAMDGLREEVTQFVGSGMESLFRNLLSSDEFHAALAHVASLGINYGVERGLRMGGTDVEFEAAVQKVSNFHAGAKADFDKALVDFPTTPFPSLSKIVAASGGTLSDMA